MVKKKTDPRFRFVRVLDDVFAGLDDYKNSPSLRMRNKSIKYPIKKDKTNDLANQVGDYFGLLTQGITGGIYQKNYKNYENGLMVQPDLISQNHEKIWESKAIRAGESVRLGDTQVSKYVYLQKILHEELGGKYPVISYQIYRHRIQELFKELKEKPTERLINKISKNTLNLISLPLDVIITIHSKKGRNKIDGGKKKGDKGIFSSRDESKTWYGSNTSINATALNNFIAYPEKTLEIFGLDSENYIIKKTRLLQTVKVNESLIHPFPILIIKNKHYQKWAKEFMEGEGKEYVDFYERSLDEKHLENNFPVELEDWLKSPKDRDDVPF